MNGVDTFFTCAIGFESGEKTLGLELETNRWDRLAHIYDRDREIASRAYLDLIAGHGTREVDKALKMGLGSPMVIEVPYVLELLGDVRGKRVLDAGCGGGFYSLWLSERGAEVTGVDSSKEMVRIAWEKASKRKLDARFLAGDITDLRIEDASFDLVLSTLVLMNVKDLEKAASELVRVTRDGGYLLISVEHPILTAGDWQRESGQKLFRKLDDYFTQKQLETVWKNSRRQEIPLLYYHRSLQSYAQAFMEKGCILTHLAEPQPKEAYQILNPKEYEDTKRIPHFAVFKFRKETPGDAHPIPLS